MSVQIEKPARIRGAKPAGLYLMELRSRVVENNPRRGKLIGSIILPERGLAGVAKAKSRSGRKAQ